MEICIASCLWAGSNEIIITEKGDVKKQGLSTKVPPVFYIEESLAKYVEAKPDEPEEEGD